VDIIFADIPAELVGGRQLNCTPANQGEEIFNQSFCG